MDWLKRFWENHIKKNPALVIFFQTSRLWKIFWITTYLIPGLVCIAYIYLFAFNGMEVVFGIADFEKKELYEEQTSPIFVLCYLLFFIGAIVYFFRFFKVAIKALEKRE